MYLSLLWTCLLAGRNLRPGYPHHNESIDAAYQHNDIVQGGTTGQGAEDTRTTSRQYDHKWANCPYPALVTISSTPLHAVTALAARLNSHCLWNLVCSDLTDWYMAIWWNSGPRDLMCIFSRKRCERVLLKNGSILDHQPLTTARW